MKQMIILGLAVAGVALIPCTASAASDDKYPAANFQPKVVYIDQDAVEKYSSKAAKKTEKKKVLFDPKYPAAYFEPKVIYP